MIISLLRWTARLTGILFSALFTILFVGEGISTGLGTFTVPEIALLLCIPVLFTVGVIIAFRAEIAGGLLMVTSVLGFNLIDILISDAFSLQCEFWYLFIPALLFIGIHLKTGKRSDR